MLSETRVRQNQRLLEWLLEENEELVPQKTKNKHGEANKRDTLMEKVDQGNKTICEAIQTLSTHIASLQQTPPSQQRRVSEEPDRKYRAQ